MNKLKTELQEVKYTGKTDQECLDMLLDKNISVKQDISAHAIQKYLALKGKLLIVEASAKKAEVTAATKAVRMLEIFSVFAMSEPDVEAALVTLLDELVAQTLIDAVDKTAILAMGSRLVNTVELLGLGKVRIGYIAGART